MFNFWNGLSGQFPGSTLICGTGDPCILTSFLRPSDRPGFADDPIWFNIVLVNQGMQIIQMDPKHVVILMVEIVGTAAASPYSRLERCGSTKDGY